MKNIGMSIKIFVNSSLYSLSYIFIICSDHSNIINDISNTEIADIMSSKLSSNSSICMAHIYKYQ